MHINIGDIISWILGVLMASGTIAIIIKKYGTKWGKELEKVIPDEIEKDIFNIFDYTMKRIEVHIPNRELREVIDKLVYTIMEEATHKETDIKTLKDTLMNNAINFISDSVKEQLTSQVAKLVGNPDLKDIQEGIKISINPFDIKNKLLTLDIFKKL